jgi:hypothetical protein
MFGNMPNIVSMYFSQIAVFCLSVHPNGKNTSIFDSDLTSYVTGLNSNQRFVRVEFSLFVVGLGLLWCDPSLQRRPAIVVSSTIQFR